MGKLRDLVEKVSKVTEEQQEVMVFGIIYKEQSYLLDLNTGQLMGGVDAKDQPLQKYRSPLYAEFKKTLNPLGVTDLKLTGDFHRSFFIASAKFPLVISARDEKLSELIYKYGKDIFGLTEQSKVELVEHIQAQVQQAYRRLLLL